MKSSRASGGTWKPGTELQGGKKKTDGVPKGRTILTEDYSPTSHSIASSRV